MTVKEKSLTTWLSIIAGLLGIVGVIATGASRMQRLEDGEAMVNKRMDYLEREVLHRLDAIDTKLNRENR